MRRTPLLLTEDIEGRLARFCVLFAYHSGKIENEQITFPMTREIFASGRVSNYTGNLRTLHEIENQKRCFLSLRPYVEKKRMMDVAFIRQVQRTLTEGTYDASRLERGERPGEFKRHRYVAGIHGAGAAPKEVAERLEKLLESIHAASVTDHFLAGVYFHAAFENIHPFADGNGRSGRLLMNYYFLIHDIAPVIVYEDEKEAYYRALEAYDVYGDLDMLADHILTQQKRTWVRTKNRRNRRLSTFVTEVADE